MKNQVLVISILLIIATFIKSASAQIEVCTNNNVKIGAATTSDARLTIAAQFGGPSNSNLVIGTWGTSALSLGVQTNYSWIQSYGGLPLTINQTGNVLINSAPTTGNVGIGYNLSNIWTPSAK
jgi:hypothetical protein